MAAALLKVGNPQVLEPALDNARLTEADLYKLLQVDKLRQHVVQGIAEHPKWSLRYDVRLQLVRHPVSPLGVVLGLLPKVKPQDLKLLLSDKRMRPELREYLQAELGKRARR